MAKVNHRESLFELLEQNFNRFNTPDFVEDDPISIPHQFSRKEDIEISAFLAAVIAWGQRITIIRNANRIVELMDHSPYEFIMQHRESDLERLEGFVHRTFNSDDLMYFLQSLQQLYLHKGGLEAAFLIGNNYKERISNFKKLFFEQEHLKRSEKHLADPLKGSSAKRLNMFLRWMVRKDPKGVDFGIWEKHDQADLMIPLDIHTSTVGRKLGLLKRKQDDWKAVEELTSNLRSFDPKDPAKYDFALFGMGVNKII
ncbi:MAG: TIGR02757 family protein [Flavobacteriales bacterium]|nr:TIGR02757 family protein [Flavobacteriales bacterium]